MPRPFPSTDPNAPDPHPDEYARLRAWEDAGEDPAKYRKILVERGMHIPDGYIPPDPKTGSSSEENARNQPTVEHP